MANARKQLAKEGFWLVSVAERPQGWQSMPILEPEILPSPQRRNDARANHIALDLRKFEDWEYANSFPSLETVGALFNDLRAKYRAAKFEEIRAYPFVKSVYPPCFENGQKSRRHIPNQVRRDVLSSGPCVRCGTFEVLTVDHILPVSHGGGDERSNLQPMCFSCNVSKGNRRVGV